MTIRGTKEYRTDILSCFLIFTIPTNISKTLYNFHNMEISKYILSNTLKKNMLFNYSL